MKSVVVPFVLIISMFSVAVFGQKAPVNKKIINSKATSIKALSDLIAKTYTKPEERLEAAYQWVTHNIRYDLRQTNSRAKSLTQAEITATAFQSGKAVCEGYAGVFDSLAHLMNIPSYLVSGYTRILGQVDATPHVWVANRLGDKWLLSDPTFGSGAMVGNRFVAEYKPAFLMVLPAKMIQSHMPYDPLWQFLASPLTHQGFIQKKTNETWNLYYKSHADSLRTFLALSKEEQYKAEHARIERQEHNFQAVIQRLNFLTEAIDIANYNNTVRLINSISATFNQAVGAYNEYATSYNDFQQQRKGKIKTGALQQADILLDSCEKMLLSGRYPPQLLDEAKKIQKSLFEFQQKVRDAK